jgi:hypothetical protein
VHAERQGNTFGSKQQRHGSWMLVQTVKFRSVCLREKLSQGFIPRSWDRYPTRSRPRAFTLHIPAFSFNEEKWRTDAVAAAAKVLWHDL